MSSTLLSSRHQETAIERWDHPSEQYEERVQSTLTQLQASVLNLSPIKQASSLGPEDIVITHLLETLGLQVPVFVLETGALNHETLALLERLQAHTKLPLEIYRPKAEQVIEFVKTKGQKAIYNSIEDRKACCHIRKLEPLSRALKGQRAWITGLRREQSSARAQVSFIAVSYTHLTLPTNREV